MESTLGTYADQLYAAEAMVKQAKEELLVFEKRRNDLKEVIMDIMVRNDQTLAAGKLGKVQINYKKIPVVKPENWGYFYDYVHAYKAYHLFQKRLATTAVLEELEGGEEIPVDIITTKTLKITKL